jgi:hypothetical protein
MTMRDYEAARELLQKHDELADFAGPRDARLVERAEEVLRVRFSPTYRSSYSTSARAASAGPRSMA